jgi:deoxyribodipyrimidine photo-lyase
MRPLIWFRSDLRLDDNLALTEASRRATRGLVAAFAITPHQWIHLHHWSPSRISLVLRTLGELSAALAERNIPLRIITEPTFEALPQRLLDLATQLECSALFFNREYEWNERQRDAAVAATFQRASLPTYSLTDRTLFEPGQLRTQAGTAYTVFTPFKRAALAQIADAPPTSQPPPMPQPALVCEPDPIPNPHDLITGESHEALWPAGEREAASRLERFTRDHLADYKLKRDLLSEPATSVLSPYLAIGAISIRRCAAAAIDRIGQNLTAKTPPPDVQGPATWLSELLWREFYSHVLVAFPRVSKGLAFRREAEAIAWDHNPDHFAAWCTGRTGFPIVDASMRQLLATGWMHNRARMIAAMFLTKDLGLDWKLGEEHFMKHLIDGDLANNNGGWQWSASTGTDAQPYFRIFNPTSQSERFDPHGHYIRRYVPEIAALDHVAIHDPTRLGFAAANLDYPAPIVNHAHARERTLARFKSLKAGPA